MGQTVKIAALQAEPVWNDLQGGVDKSIKLIGEAASNGANVIGFPEVFIPGSMWHKGPSENTKFMNEYFQNSMERESPEMDRIRAAVKEAGVFVVMAYSERYRGTLYIAQSFIDEQGDIVHHRRKVKPTHVERAYWGDGQGESLQTVVPSTFGRIGGLNCWEHTQTLLRYYEYSQNPDIHCSSWPCLFPVDQENGEEWPYHITPECCQAFSRVLSMEGACFVMIASQVVSKECAARTGIEGFHYVDGGAEKKTKLPGGGFSMIYTPFGQEMCKPLPAGEEGILYADCDLERRDEARQNLDVVGHYARPDQLSLRVNAHPAKPVFFAEGP